MIRRAGPIACVLALAALGGALLGGCGGGTQTVSVSSAPLPPTTSASTGAHTTSTTAPTTAPAHPAQTTATPSGTVTQSESGQPTSTTRTAPAPAFVHTGGQSSEQGSEQGTSGAVAAAAAVVTAHGYTPDVSTYRPNQTLRVLIGTRTGSADGYNQRAFFFLDNHYIGTDSGQPSASLRVVSQSDTEVALAYALYRPHDSLCCPSGGNATVRFQLNNGQLVPLSPIPPASSSTGLARQ
jgi:hypothetical protein